MSTWLTRGYTWSFYFWMDFMGMVSVLLDISFIAVSHCAACCSCLVIADHKYQRLTVSNLLARVRLRVLGTLPLPASPGWPAPLPNCEAGLPEAIMLLSWDEPHRHVSFNGYAITIYWHIHICSRPVQAVKAKYHLVKYCLVAVYDGRTVQFIAAICIDVAIVRRRLLSEALLH